jgi:hypothetical protein
MRNAGNKDRLPLETILDLFHSCEEDQPKTACRSLPDRPTCGAAPGEKCELSSCSRCKGGKVQSKAEALNKYLL